jgi:hypothetical protein
VVELDAAVAIGALVVTTASAVAAFQAARATRDTATRSNLPFVWVEPTISREPAIEVVRDSAGHEYGQESQDFEAVTIRPRLRNDGPGMAQDVRWSIYRPHEADPWWLRGAVRRFKQSDPRGQAETAASASKAIRAMQGGATEDAEPMTIHLLADEPWFIVVRYTDTAGKRWEFSESGDARSLAGAPYEVRDTDW